MHYLFSCDIYFSTTWHIPVYEGTYKTLGHKHPVIYTAADMGEYSSPKKYMELERDYLLTLSGINPERSLETHKIFYAENH